MRTASITLRGDRIIIHPWSKAVSGVGLGTPPFVVLDAQEAPHRIGEALRQALAAVQEGLPHPAPDEWSEFDAPLYAAAGVKNWASFIKGAVSSEVVEQGGELQITPWKNMGSRKGFQPAGIESVKLPSDSDATSIGRAVLKALALAENADSQPEGGKISAKKKQPELTPAMAGPTSGELPTGPEAVTHRKLLRDLERLGFFSYTEPSQLDQERERILRQGWQGIFGENGRLFLTDAEDLAEGGVSLFISELTPFLSLQGVTLPPLEDRFDASNEYVLIAGDKELAIWKQSELAREDDRPGLIWGVSTTRTIRLLNDWLEDSGSKERAYAVYGGNDLAIYFLTPELFRRITRDPEASPHDGPYVPNLKYPNLGQPED